MHDFIFDVLALEENNTINSGDDHQLSDAVNILIELRNQARDNKDFQTSDLIRDQLKEAGIHLKDGKEGTTFSLNL
jgi:cysteinyl-tRNA synthetase